jgi:L-amino acid N-acyltransferase YncA
MLAQGTNLLTRLADKVRSLGWTDTVWFIVDALLQRLSRGTARLTKFYFVAQPVVAARSPPARAANTGTRMYVAADADAIIRQAPRPEATIRSRFEQRARCVVAERNGELAGFIWLCPDQYTEDAVRCVYRWTPAEVAVWDFDVFIGPQFRMGRLFSRLWQHAHALLAEEGVRWTVSCINAFNPGSLTAHRKLGARVMADGLFFRFGSVQVTACSVAPFVHFSMHDANAPRLCFDLSPLRVPFEAS